MYKLVNIFKSPKNAAYFFGYFNTPQVCSFDKKILALEVSSFDEMPSPGSVAKVGYFDMSDTSSQFHQIGTTNAFNWQQGAMLQFVGPSYSDNVIWNFYDGRSYKSQLLNLQTEETHFLPAIYAVSPYGDFALTVDFERHYWCRRGYSYGLVRNNKKDLPICPGDGIFKVDLKSSSIELLIEIEELIDLERRSNMAGAVHYVEHVTISPNGKLFAFLHRWKTNQGIHSRLLVSDVNGRDLRIVNDSGRMSHFCWKSDAEIFGYGGKKNRLNQLRTNAVIAKSIFSMVKPIYRMFVRDDSRLSKKMTGDGYYIFDVNNPDKVTPVAQDLWSDDGHPVVMPTGNHFITDTYARSKYSLTPKLFLGDFNGSESIQLDELGSIAKFDETPMRCDLHPRVSRSGSIVSIDTMDRRQRGVYAYRLEQL